MTHRIVNTSMFPLGFGIFHFSRHSVLLHVMFININSGKLGDINA